MDIVWSPDAVADLAETRAYIAEDDPKAAAEMVQRIIETVETILPSQPAIGRPGRVTGTRELVITRTPFIVPYRLRDRRIEIIRVYHSARKWPKRL